MHCFVREEHLCFNGCKRYDNQLSIYKYIFNIICSTIKYVGISTKSKTKRMYLNCDNEFNGGHKGDKKKLFYIWGNTIWNNNRGLKFIDIRMIIVRLVGPLSTCFFTYHYTIYVQSKSILEEDKLQYWLIWVVYITSSKWHILVVLCTLH